MAQGVEIERVCKVKQESKITGTEIEDANARLISILSEL